MIEENEDEDEEGSEEDNEEDNEGNILEENEEDGGDVNDGGGANSDSPMGSGSRDVAATGAPPVTPPLPAKDVPSPLSTNDDGAPPATHDAGSTTPVPEVRDRHMSTSSASWTDDVEEEVEQTGSVSAQESTSATLGLAPRQ
ncbi:uncharacterized protein LOC126335649 [Schistocerca gregaria]|uniref:uncharacterized protein LOC126335649 n=1 Tax=Schistocerca gregaria TaxID=7010 RepID=UPI00211E74A2|nr:uncharacterized protein LOC126335649 [Schistocerca gregaria]